MVSKKFEDLIGTDIKLTGPVFSYKKEFQEPTEFKVLKARCGTATVIDMNDLTDIYGTVELLLKREGMKRAQWSKPIPDFDNKIDDDDF